VKGSAVTAIVVLNFNGLHHLHGLFAGLAQQTRRDFVLVLVDNASRDGSQAAIPQLATAFHVPTILIENTENRGFAAACNQGIAATDAPWLVMLNNDTIPEPGWLDALLRAADGQTDVGMVASKMLFAHAPDRINSAGIAVDWTGIAWDAQGGMPDDPQESTVREIFGPCAGAGLYARAMLDEIGGFDEAFFAYLEDVDLAWRGRLAGWRCLYQPQARVLHAHSATSGEGSPFKSYLLGRNKVWLLAKNYPQPWFALWLPVIIAYDLMATIYGWATRGDAALLRGRGAGLRRLPAVLRARREIQRRWQHHENWAPFVAPVAWPWRVSRRYTHLQSTKLQSKRRLS
jgi:GT2 family glycosyltransferase